MIDQLELYLASTWSQLSWHSRVAKLNLGDLGGKSCKLNLHCSSLMWLSESLKGRSEFSLDRGLKDKIENVPWFEGSHLKLSEHRMGFMGGFCEV